MEKGLGQEVNLQPEVLSNMEGFKIASTLREGARMDLSLTKKYNDYCP